MKKFVRTVFGLLALVAVILVAGTLFYGTKTVHDLLGENKKLKEAISTLTTEEQIGYAKVLMQEARDGQLYTTLRFVETERGNPLKTVLQKEVEIEGDIVHFDALIVSFSGQAVIDGKDRSLYLWRRVYGDNQAPSAGFEIEEPGAEPARYAGLLSRLRLKDQQMFWNAIWDLANDPEALEQHGIKAVYGNAVYKKLRPGLIYVFKISPTGQLIPETVPDL
ncbi:hypothetical protein [Tichowtungia aerotolerans]|uniref:Uncharacterized protein n=1 Tax=Tichowtungia aerotolerans TaxID=2697043 RepID=A0A6P1M6W1_9BACT|nr:hypothetical protein [Tichowtungia aerotolerans]QHI67938.1 hypothetical protein GT409_00240 [Tichowtungia aerotolerans]